jgi:D-amino-acid oxidase
VPHVLVVGGGIIGSSTAVRLREAALDVTIWTADIWSSTTSNIAAAIWWPFHAHPALLVEAWAARSREVYEELAESQPKAGVRLVPGRVLKYSASADPLRSVTEHHTVPIIDISAYLPWLTRRGEDLGVRTVLRRISTLDEALAESDIVVNCTGLGAAALVPDPTMTPIRGQVLRVECAGIDRFFLDEGASDVTYVVPRGRDVILGGTVEPGVWSTTPDPVASQNILERCIAAEPALASARILEHRVGLRPGRPTVRLETEVRGPGRAVIHNYGHGGSGVTIAWGCAEEAAALVGRMLY